MHRPAETAGSILASLVDMVTVVVATVMDAVINIAVVYRLQTHVSILWRQAAALGALPRESTLTGFFAILPRNTVPRNCPPPTPSLLSFYITIVSFLFYADTTYSSMTRQHAVKPAPTPPYSSGISIDMNPLSKSPCMISFKKGERGGERRGGEKGGRREMK